MKNTIYQNNHVKITIEKIDESESKVNINYEEILEMCKDEVARKHGYQSFVSAQFMGEFYNLIHEAALLAMQRIATGQYEVNFDGHVKTLLKIEDGQLIVEAAMNGYGDAIDKNKIIITNKS